MFVDSHAHIDGEEFDADRDEVVARARAAGVRAILNVGTGDPRGGQHPQTALRDVGPELGQLDPGRAG